MRVSLIQMYSEGTRKENEEKALILMKKAVQEKPDIICLSELFSRWGKEFDNGCWNFSEVEKYQIFARENNVNIILGSISLIDKNTGKDTNTCFVINRNGEIIHRYDKKYMYKVNRDDLIVDEGEETIAGQTIGVFELEGIKMGVGIFFDLRYPEYFRELIKEGAEIIFLPAHFKKATGEIAWNVLTKARAIENQVYFCACNQTGTGNCGNTQIISYEGKVVSNIDTEEGIITEEIDLEAQRKYRKEFPVLEQIN